MSTITEELKPIRFSQKIGADFNGTLKKRVRDYFKDNNISRFANANMVLKTIFMVSLYFTPYFLMVFGVITNPWLIVLCWAIMGIGIAGIGLSIMHDANHGAYSKNEKVNFWIGRVLNVVGGFAPTWNIQHNVLHHSYTNILGYDEDVSPPISLLRFSPKDKYRKIQRFQFIYAWFFYGLMTLSWITNKDFSQLFRYKKLGLTKTENEKFGRLLTELILTKIVYYLYILVIPILVMDIAWWAIPLGIILMHFIAGIILAAIFQPAHVVNETDFPVQDSNSSIENNWAIHQLQTTSNFAPKSRFFYWFVGGLNYQVEHHLFPNVCHVHYKALSKIVKQTAQEFGIPYYSEPTFVSALGNHVRMLKKLGQAA
ncbi:MAG: acyl-CoA desaturase [Bacteroidetes bacterium]|nr:acyl-CoA desaturase [Bacteroidota bacterium]